jgi:phage terminase small subunit
MKSKSQFNALSEEAESLHRRCIKEWNIRDAAGLLTLMVACQALDRLREAQALIAVEGIVSKDRFGQAKPHPATQVEKEAAGRLLQALRALNLDLETLEMGDVE